MSDLIERLRFDAARCEATFSKGVATNIEEAAAEIERLRAALKRIADTRDTEGYHTRQAQNLQVIAAQALLPSANKPKE